jgi:hypothetical protein
VRTLGRKCINAGADRMLKCADGTSSGADGKITGIDESFAYAYVCSPGADVCAVSTDVNKSCSENLEGARTECKRARAVS